RPRRLVDCYDFECRIFDVVSFIDVRTENNRGDTVNVNTLGAYAHVRIWSKMFEIHLVEIDNSSADRAVYVGIDVILCIGEVKFEIAFERIQRVEAPQISWLPAR